MLSLTKQSIVQNKSKWQEKGFNLPAFDIEKVSQDTYKNPRWLHFGPGNIFRAFPALAMQKLLNAGKADKGIIVCETFDEEIIESSLTPYDNLTCAVTLKTNGEVSYDIVASITESLTLTKNKDRLVEIFKNPSLQMVSFTITEKGYATHDTNGNVLAYIDAEAKGLPQDAKTVPAVVAYLALQRFNAGATPITLVSMDNCADNGDLLKKAVLYIANAWQGAGHVPQEFVSYLNSLAYPVSMIDKITPHPSDKVVTMLSNLGFANTIISRTSKNSVAASFVNGEESEYLFIEDNFVNGRPPLHEAGVVFTDRETVTNVEKMKVGACLNPLHTIIAVFGSILGYQTVSKAMENKGLVKILQTAGYKESLPFVPNPKVITPKDFLDTVLEVRFPNPFIPDMPQRIATDTSLKIPVRFGEVLKTMKKDGFDITTLDAIPFFVAGWFRYLTQLDDNGEKFNLSPDPMLPQLLPIFEGYSLGDTGLNDDAKKLLTNEAIFGINLVEAGLLDKIESSFNKLLSAKGAVEKSIDEF